MKIYFENAQDRRKELVQALSEVMDTTPKYQGTPSFTFTVGQYTVYRDASLEVSELEDTDEIGLILHGLRGRGFTPKPGEWQQLRSVLNHKSIIEGFEKIGVETIGISFPKSLMDERTLANLRKMVQAKGPLIELALGVTELPVEETDEAITFNWLPHTAPPELVQATMQMLSAMVKLAGDLKRVTATEKPLDNPRYAFRCWLLRLGFIGDEYKSMRRLLMQGIPGNGSKRYIETEPQEAVEQPVDIQPCMKLTDYPNYEPEPTGK